MKRLLTACAIATLAACSPGDDGKSKEQAPTPAAVPLAAPAPAPIVPLKTDVPAGAYTLDKAHASLIFRVNHIGFSNYTGRFSKFDAQLTLDPVNPGASSVSATIDPGSLGLENPPSGFVDEITSAKWLDAKGFPQMTFRSSKIELTSANTARITGDFSFHGVTRPVTLDASFNGGYAGNAYEPHARIGFSARGSLRRAEFSVKEGVPPPGSTFGVSDNVDIIIEAEFTGPPLAAPAPK